MEKKLIKMKKNGFSSLLLRFLIICHQSSSSGLQNSNALKKKIEKTRNSIY